MKKISILTASVSIFLLVTACNQANKGKRILQTDNPLTFLSVDQVYASGDSMANNTIHVKGTIEHVCHHTWKRFKIIGNNENHFIKVELDDKFPSVDASILGKEVNVTGKLLPVKMDDKMVLMWETQMKRNHKGEEDTEHFKEELAYIQNVYRQITTGEIPYYTTYTLEAENYELE
jgi:hypothetical protein